MTSTKSPSTARAAVVHQYTGGPGLGSSAARPVVLVSLPILVSLFRIPFLFTLTLVLIGLSWQWWDSSLKTFATLNTEKYKKWPELELETISLSHYGEKVRWCLDRLGVEYTERPVAAIIGIFFLGRSVPVLRVAHNPLSKSAIGNSSDILRFLYGMYQNSGEANADFLAETPESRELEQSLDTYGRMVQAWVYSYCLDEKEAVLQAWGGNDPKLPPWQRVLLRLCYPALVVMLKSAFRLKPKDEARQRSLGKIREILGGLEERLVAAAASSNKKEPPFLLEGRLSYVDITLAALTGVWLSYVDEGVAESYGPGAFDGVRIPQGSFPAVILQDAIELRDAFPKVMELVSRLYRDERQAVA